MAKSSFTDSRSKFDKITEELSLAENAYVLIGFQQGTVTKSQTKDKRTKKAGLSIPEIAAENEFGTMQIPARSFMRTSFDENAQLIGRAIENQYDKIAEGKSTTKKSLGLIGLLMKDLIQVKIRQITTPPNAASTIRVKKSSKPLIDFGQMVSAVDYKVVM